MPAIVPPGSRDGATQCVCDADAHAVQNLTPGYSKAGSACGFATAMPECNAMPGAASGHQLQIQIWPCSKKMPGKQPGVCLSLGIVQGILLMTLAVNSLSLKTYSWNMRSGAGVGALSPASATPSKDMLPFADWI